MRIENTRSRGPNWPGGVRHLAPAVEVRVDRAALAALRAEVGAAAFDEVFETAAFEAAEGFGRIEALLAKEMLASLALAAADIAAVSCVVGLAGVADIAADLASVAEAGDGVAARAIGARLLRVGEESLIHAAELSVELGARAEEA
ncbi:hypothetical protein [Pikeienuella sp. HZG-20]|uniref:hypothetical protein n=1 Tax=Paludibacillus litoralis TaxID=3133267 RepID=UPI0030ED8432